MKLSVYLRLHNMSPREFARRIGVNVSTVYSMLNNKYDPSYDTILRVEVGTHNEVTRYDIHSRAYEIWPQD